MPSPQRHLRALSLATQARLSVLAARGRGHERKCCRPSTGGRPARPSSLRVPQSEDAASPEHPYCYVASLAYLATEETWGGAENHDCATEV